MLHTWKTLAVAFLCAATGALTAQEPPTDWVDPATGHRVVRLTREPGSASLYFHQNGYTAGGDKLVITTPGGLSAIDLQTRAVTPIVAGRASQVVVAKRSRLVFYFRGDTVFATHIDSRVTRMVAYSPGLRSGSGLAVNADETLLAGSMVDSAPPAPAAATTTASPKPAEDNPPGKGAMMERRLAARIPMALFTIDIATGAVKRFNPSTDWLGHVQFSPTDPGLIMYCHEGPWHKVDRIWTIRTDGTGLTKIHSRTMDMEIAGHEFFSADGRTIWYDLQTPKGKEFWLAGAAVGSAQRQRYRVERDQWSVHFNASPAGTLFAGDGGGPNSVAAPGNGQWIYLFTPGAGALHGERLVNLASHNYRLEPNVTFTPDMKWIVFRSNMHGPTHVYAVEVQKSR